MALISSRIKSPYIVFCLKIILIGYVYFNFQSQAIGQSLNKIQYHAVANNGEKICRENIFVNGATPFWNPFQNKSVKGLSSFSKFRFIPFKSSISWKSSLMESSIAPYMIIDYPKSVFLTIIITSLILCLLFYLYHIKQHKSIIRQQLHISLLKTRVLRSQMNPHFIFNTLNSLQYLVVLNDPKSASYYFKIFSNLIRSSLEMSRTEFTDLKNEIHFIEDYLKIEKMRLDEELEYHISIDPEIDLEFIEIPCMLVQPCIENAIIHGLKPKKNNRKLIIDFKRNKNTLEIKIEDNGIGMHASKKIDKKNHASLARAILMDRIELFNQLYKQIISMNTENASTNPKYPGTRILIKVPIGLNT